MNRTVCAYPNFSSTELSYKTGSRDRIEDQSLTVLSPTCICLI
jgi:hypothetical protein